jgi:hypothetical protein
MIKSRVFIFTFFIGLWSCSPDIDKDITTDVQVEGREIFRISNGLEEIYFTALQPYENFLVADTLSLPGCPDIQINDSEKKITLTYSEERECPSKGDMPRNGKIHLSFVQANILETLTLVEYEDYQVQNFKLEGLRTFRRISSTLNPNRRTEQFSDLFIIDESGSSSRLDGDFEYNLILSNGELSEIRASGEIQGRNVTGRPIQMNSIQARRYRSICIFEGSYLPQQGEENWQIFRTATLSTSHNLVYENEEGCISQAKITLSDGRLLILP